MTGWYLGDRRLLRRPWQVSCKGRVGWHGHRRWRAATAWTRGPPEAWVLSFGRWEDKCTAMEYEEDFENPRVLGDLILLSSLGTR